MTERALVVDDDPDIARGVADALVSMGHGHEWVKSQEEAREKLAAGGYSYVLLDLAIPVRFGHGLPCTEYGQHLAREIHRSPAMAGVPIIVMTCHGKEGMEMAAPLCEHGVVAFIHKPFPSTGRTLSSVIETVLERRRRRQETLAALDQDQPPTTPFQGGALVFWADHIELCGVKVVSSGKASQMGEILAALRGQMPNGRYKAMDGATLARAVHCVGGQASVAGSIRDFRKHVAEIVGKELGLKVGRQDVIESGGSGYRLRPWISIQDQRPTTPDPAARSDSTPGPQPLDPQAYILRELGKGRSLRAPDLASEVGCSASTIKRMLETLKREGRIVFVGPARTGSYRQV